MMNINKSIYYFGFAFSLLVGCGEKDAEILPVEDKEVVDKSRVYSIKANGGENRIKLSWMLDPDPKVTKVKVYWNNKADSVELPVDQGAGVNTMQVLLNNLEEGAKTFRIFTFDGINSPTFKKEISGTVYGDIYKSKIQPRGIKSTLVSKGTAVIDWYFAAKEVIGVKLNYMDTEGVLQEMSIHSSTATTSLENFGANAHFEYQTYYVPEEDALDTFSVVSSSEGAIRYRSPLTKQIVYDTDLVETVLFDTLIDVHEGLEQTNLQYNGKNGRIIAMYILAADLNNSNIAIKAATPYNKSDYNRQVVTGIAQSADAPGNLVVAAVNADYFVNSVPVGYVVKNSELIKTESREDASYFAIYKDGTMAIKKNTYFSAEKENIQEALGGYHRLIQNHKKVAQADKTVHPRTIVGYTAGKTVYFIVIDGRQSGYSIGMDFAQASDIMYALGAKDALNLDGGGSSTFVTKDLASDSWKVRNKPSDGSQRAVANAWTVVSLQ